MEVKETPAHWHSYPECHMETLNSDLRSSSKWFSCLSMVGVRKKHTSVLRRDTVLLAQSHAQKLFDSCKDGGSTIWMLFLFFKKKRGSFEFGGTSEENVLQQGTPESSEAVRHAQQEEKNKLEEVCAQGSHGTDLDLAELYSSVH